jgi:hypothetical protein
MCCHHRCSDKFVCGDDLRSVYELHHLNVLRLSDHVCDRLPDRYLSGSRVLCSDIVLSDGPRVPTVPHAGYGLGLSADTPRGARASHR